MTTQASFDPPQVHTGSVEDYLVLGVLLTASVLAQLFLAERNRHADNVYSPRLAWMRALLILSLLVLAVAAGLYFQSRPVPDSGVLRVSGNIEITDAEVSFKIAGRVVERSASEGESVKAGQSVARLDTSELAQEVALRSAEVRAAEASLAELVTGSRPEEIAQSEAVVRRMQADVARARADFKRLKKLYEQDNVSGQDYDAAKSAVEVTTAKLRPDS